MAEESLKNPVPTAGPSSGESFSAADFARVADSVDGATVAPDSAVPPPPADPGVDVKDLFNAFRLVSEAVGAMLHSKAVRLTVPECQDLAEAWHPVVSGWAARFLAAIGSRAPWMVALSRTAGIVKDKALALKAERLEAAGAPDDVQRQQ